MNLVYTVAIIAGIWHGTLLQYNPPVKTAIDNPVFVAINIDLQLGIVFIKGGVHTDMWVMQQPSFFFYQNTYNFGVGLRKDWFEIGYEHSCFHPSMPYMWYANYQVTPSWEGWSGRLYGKISLTNKK